MLRLRRGLPAGLALGAIAVGGCGGGGGGGDTEQPVVKTMKKIHDRAVAAGYEVLKCRPGTAGAKCVNGFRVIYSGGKVHSAGFSILKNGLWSPGPDAIGVDAYPNPQDLRAADEAQRDSAGERERLTEGNSRYVVVGDRLWFTNAPDAKVPKKKFLGIVGKLEGCAPNCRFERPSTTKPTTTTTGPDLGPPTAKQAAAALAPIVRRSKAAGYTVYPPKGNIVVISGKGTDSATASVYATPAGARDAASLNAEFLKEGKPGPKHWAVIGNRYWDIYTPAGTTEQFRRLVETAEGCGSKCRFSVSSFK